ncbi:MAG: hypothetical protein QM636_11130 [Rhizobium sp.]
MRLQTLSRSIVSITAFGLLLSGVTSLPATAEDNEGNDGTTVLDTIVITSRKQTGLLRSADCLERIGSLCRPRTRSGASFGKAPDAGYA